MWENGSSRTTWREACKSQLSLVKSQDFFFHNWYFLRQFLLYFGDNSFYINLTDLVRNLFCCFPLKALSHDFAVKLVAFWNELCKFFIVPNKQIILHFLFNLLTNFLRPLLEFSQLLHFDCCVIIFYDDISYVVHPDFAIVVFEEVDVHAHYVVIVNFLQIISHLGTNLLTVLLRMLHLQTQINFFLELGEC